MIEPDIKEAVARELDWRQWLDDHPNAALDDDERVLICIPCADELEADTTVSDLEYTDE